MNRLIACALLGVGLASSVAACSDDDDTTPDDTAGTDSGGSSTAGKNSGGAGKAGSPTAGTAGKATGGTGGSTGGGAGETTGGTDAVGGVPAGGAGGDDGVGGEAVGGDGAGGEGGSGGVTELPPQIANPYWLNKFCDSQADETLACENSSSWAECYNIYYPFLSDGGSGGICVLETDMENFPLTVGLTLELDATAEACGATTEADWSCDLSGLPSPRVQACRTANDKLKAAYDDCGGA
jgi:hypothetical protein